MSDYYYGQGKLYLARRNAAGQALSWRWIGDVSALALEIDFDEKISKASQGGRLVNAQRFISAENAKITSTWHEYSRENLQLLFLSGRKDKATSIVDAEALPLGIEAGNMISLRNPNVFGITIPSLTEGVDYRVEPLFGMIEFLTTPAHQPVMVNYAHVSYSSLPILNERSEEFSLRYEGVNLAEDKSQVLIELYRVSFDLLSKIELINNESNLSELETSATLLSDFTKLADDELGQFGRIIKFKQLSGITHNGAIYHDGRYQHGGN